MRLLEGAVRTYDWGSPTAIPDLLGRPGTGEPWAEIWFGAHPLAPATAGPEAEPLDRLIAADPAKALGAAVAARFGRLPFLVKVLAASTPLSLQAHPSAAQAEAGFEREEELGIARDASGRMFRDRSGKPEMVCALSSFEVLCGFRDTARTGEFLDTIPTAVLDPVRRRLRTDSPAARRELLRWLLRLGPATARALVHPVASWCRDEPGDDEWTGARRAVADLGKRFPNDGSVVAALLLNHVVLEPGEALFLAAGQLHAYLGGMALEAMAESDNVVRGGFTTKHVDVDTLIEVVDPAITEIQVLRPEARAGVAAYRVPAKEFSLSRLEVDGSLVAGQGPAVLLCVDGCAESAGVTLDRGSAAWVDGTEPPVVLSGRATVYRVGADVSP